MMKRYSVVGFISEEGHPVEIIPSSWLAGDESCFWPGGQEVKVLKSMIMKCAQPHESWSLLPIKLYGKSNSFTAATKKAQKALLLSSLDSDSSEDGCNIVGKKRVSQLPMRYKNTSSEEDEESESLVKNVNNGTKRRRERLYTLPKPPQGYFPIKNNLMSNENEENVLSLNSKEAHVEESFTEPQGTTALSEKQLEKDSIDDFLQTAPVKEETVLENILKHLIDLKRDSKIIRKEIKVLREKVEMRLEENPKVAAALSGIINADQFENLPLSSMADLQVLEKEITQDATKATSLARFLCRGGGFSNFNSLTLLVIKRLFARNIALLYSVEGRQEKLKFSDLNLFNVVVASVKMMYEDTETSAISSRIGKVLAGAADWDGNRNKRRRKEKENHVEIN